MCCAHTPKIIAMHSGGCDEYLKLVTQYKASPTILDN